MDVNSHSWLKRCRISGFKPLLHSNAAKDLPDLPIVFDTHKSEILAQIELEKQNGEPKSEEEKEN